MFGEQWGLIEWISFFSFLVGIENLELNEKQIDNLEQHLSKQDAELLSTIIKQNEQIIQMLEEKDAQKND